MTTDKELLERLRKFEGDEELIEWDRSAELKATLTAAIQRIEQAAPSATAAIPKAVRDWQEAERLRVAAVETYNKRVEYARAHDLGTVSCDAEYQEMCRTQKAASSLLKPMYEALDSQGTAARVEAGTMAHVLSKETIEEWRVCLTSGKDVRYDRDAIEGTALCAMAENWRRVEEHYARSRMKRHESPGGGNG